MSNPYVNAGEIAVHGLEASSHTPWASRIIRKVTKRAEKSWVAEHVTKHPPVNDDTIIRNDNDAHPTQDLAVSQLFEQLFGEIWQKADQLAGTGHSEIYQLAEREALRELNRVLDTNAILKLPPDEFMRVRSDMEAIAQAAVRETRNLAAAEKTPVALHSFREKIKNSVHKYIGHARNHGHVQVSTHEARAATPSSTLSQLCSHFHLDIRLPTLSLPTQS